MRIVIHVCWKLQLGVLVCDTSHTKLCLAPNGQLLASEYSVGAAPFGEAGAADVLQIIISVMFFTRLDIKSNALSIIAAAQVLLLWWKVMHAPCLHFWCLPLQMPKIMLPPNSMRACQLLVSQPVVCGSKTAFLQDQP